MVLCMQLGNLSGTNKVKLSIAWALNLPFIWIGFDSSQNRKIQITMFAKYTSTFIYWFMSAYNIASQHNLV